VEKRVPEKEKIQTKKNSINLWNFQRKMVKNEGKLQVNGGD